MKKPKPGESYFFVDESGDPVFYDQRGTCIVGQGGCSRLLILGFIQTHNPDSLRDAVLECHRDVMADSYLQGIPSLSKTAIAFHAKDDVPEVRERFFKCIKELEFKAQFIVARKIESVFRNSHRADEESFYNNLVTKLFQNVLHRSERNHIVFASRGSKNRQKLLERAIWRAKGRFEKQHKIPVGATFEVSPQSPKGEPCLCIADYMDWAVQRAFTAKQMRFYDFVAGKVSFLKDLYDFRPNNFYTRAKPFHISKAAPL
jgi:hypothetical protein